MNTTDAATQPEQAAQPIVVGIQPQSAVQPGQKVFRGEETRSLFRFVMPFAMVIMTGILWLIATLIYYSDPVQQWLNSRKTGTPVAVSPSPAAQSAPAAAVEAPAPVTAEPLPAPVVEEQAAVNMPVPQPGIVPAAPMNSIPAAAQAVVQPLQAEQQPGAPLAPAPQVEPAAPEAAAPSAQTPEFNVQGIMTQNGTSVVLINDRIYEQGDAINNTTIVAITPESLVISEDGQERTILLRH